MLLARVPPVWHRKKIEKFGKIFFSFFFSFQNPLLTFLSDFRFCYDSRTFAVTRPMSAVTRPMWNPSDGLQKKRPDCVASTTRDQWVLFCTLNVNVKFKTFYLSGLFFTATRLVDLLDVDWKWQLRVSGGRGDNADIFKEVASCDQNMDWTVQNSEI